MGVKDKPQHRLRRPLAAVLTVALLALAGCSTGDVESLKRLGLPEAASDRASHMFTLWIGTWIAAGVIGIGVWGLIGYAIIRYRRRGTGKSVV